MKAIVHVGKQGMEGLSLIDAELSALGPNEVKVRIKAAGMNRRDLMLLTRHKENEPYLILGSDAAGIIEEIGDHVQGIQVGDEVIINPSLGWEEKSSAPPENFQIVGLPNHGTFSERMIISSKNVEKKPTYLSWDEAGTLALAGITAYRALFTRGNIQESDTVMIPGIGSGVATFLLQFAKAAGARVIVTSRSEEKRKQAIELGADLAIDTYSDWKEELKDEQVSLLIESIGASTFNKSLDIVKPGGTIVTFGATTEDEVTIDIRKFFYAQQNLLGSTMGSREEFVEMLAFIDKYQIKPIVNKTYSPEEYNEAFTYLKNSENFGKLVFLF